MEHANDFPCAPTGRKPNTSRPKPPTKARTTHAAAASRARPPRPPPSLILIHPQSPTRSPPPVAGGPEVHGPGSAPRLGAREAPSSRSLALAAREATPASPASFPGVAGGRWRRDE